MLASRGIKVTPSQTERFIQEVCPCFSEEGKVNVMAWEKVGPRSLILNSTAAFLPWESAGLASSPWDDRSGLR